MKLPVKFKYENRVFLFFVFFSTGCSITAKATGRLRWHGLVRRTQLCLESGHLKHDRVNRSQESRGLILTLPFGREIDLFPGSKQLLYSWPLRNSQSVLKYQHLIKVGTYQHGTCNIQFEIVLYLRTQRFDSSDKLHNIITDVSKEHSKAFITTLRLTKGTFR